jgi:hypothetical protein
MHTPPTGNYLCNTLDTFVSTPIAASYSLTPAETTSATGPCYFVATPLDTRPWLQTGGVSNRLPQSPANGRDLVADNAYSRKLRQVSGLVTLGTKRPDGGLEEGAAVCTHG